MIALLFLQVALGSIGRQELPKVGCAVYLWSRGERPELVAMAAVEPATLRIKLDGMPLDLSRTAVDGAVAMGLPASTRYAAGAVSAMLNLTISERPALANGAVVSSATLTVERPGRDTIVTPLAGMIGCV